MIKVDLHLHSEASNKPGGYFSNKLKISESYVKPRKVYEKLKERGMTLFTITDHDTIDGCVEIAHLPNVFLSEEVTTYFPEDRAKIHVIVIDINEKIHQDIQKVRGNIYELVDYLQKNNITHILAHPLYNMDGKLTKSHIEKLGLLFDNWEILNGTRSKTSSKITEKIANYFSQKDVIERLADKYGFNKRRRDFISFTGGSDDHGGLDLGTGYTIAEGETVEDLKNAINEGKTHYEGMHGNPKRLTHMVMNIAKEGLKRQYSLGNFGVLLDYLFEPRQQSTYILDQILGRNSILNFIETVIKHKGEVSQDNHENIHRFFINLIPYYISNIRNQKNLDFDKLSMYLGKILIFSSSYLFYVSVYKQRADEKNFSKKIYKEFFDNGHMEGKIAYLTDTFFEINGVSRTTQKLLNLAKEENLDIKFIISYDKSIEEDEHLINFKPMFTFSLPEYEEIPINIPNFLELLDYIEQNNFDVIYAPTPGPVGLMGFAISKILGIPFVTTFHTDFPEYVYRYTSEPALKRFVAQGLKFIYNNSEKVLVPSGYYFQKLAEMGVKPEKMEVFRRGVNQEKFNPSFNDKNFWKKYDPKYNFEQVVLYVGRVAKEKDLDVFIEVYELMKNNPKVKFAIVGDGPYLKELKQTYEGKIIFTGFLEGEELSKAFASADFFLFPSTTETFGNVVLEAMASGLIPLVSDKGASKENIVEDITGFVISNNDPKEYKLILERLIENPGLSQKLRNNILKLVSNLDERSLLLEMVEKFSLGCLSKKQLEEVYVWSRENPTTQ